ncbi:hypothetical protein, partial [Bradyrhizobium guangdongense]|uniref:hypothetical protein n=1 Tax=Bradyrhizobium guangdongense TaxID=1325090 RepID=UPI001AECE0FF
MNLEAPRIRIKLRLARPANISRMRQSGDMAPQKVIVMPGLVPGIHALRAAWQGVDGRDPAMTMWG